MKKLDLFSLRGLSRSAIDNLMIDSGYKIFNVDFNEHTTRISYITYKKQDTTLDIKICIRFVDNIIESILFC